MYSWGGITEVRDSIESEPETVALSKSKTKAGVKKALTQRESMLVDRVDELMRAAASRYTALTFLSMDHFGKMEETDVKRLSAGTYMIGAKKVFAMIINGKLVLRVGGGFVSFDEFVAAQFGAERAKEMLRNSSPDMLRKSLMR